jgi:hypothetical protein
MQLRCKYCDAVQTVNTPDIDDEDPRTQGIRRTFRTEHIERCGERAVFLETDSVEATHVDPQIWHRYAAFAQPPQDVTLGGDGFFYRTITRDGASHNVRVCEDCWSNIPRYVDFPAGLISPESDGTETAVAKMRPGTVETDSPKRAAGAEHLWKAVCLPCYIAAFGRVYPEAACPDLRGDVIGDGAPIQLPPPTPASELGRETMTRWDRPA